MDYQEDEDLTSSSRGHGRRGGRAAAMVAQLLKPVDETSPNTSAQPASRADQRHAEGHRGHDVPRVRAPGAQRVELPEKDVQTTAPTWRSSRARSARRRHPRSTAPEGKGARRRRRGEMSSEYRSLLSELGVDKVPGVGAPPAAPASRLGLGSAGREQVDPRKIYAGSLPGPRRDGALRAIFEAHGRSSPRRSLGHPDGPARVGFSSRTRTPRREPAG